MRPAKRNEDVLGKPNEQHKHPELVALRWILLAGLLVGCDLKLGGGESLPATRCSRDQDCAAGDRCEPVMRACITPELSPLTVAFQFTPANNQRALLTQFVNVTFAQDNRFDLTLPEPIRIRGTITVKDDVGTHANLPGTVVAIASGAIEGTQYRFETTSSDGIPRGLDYGYELFLAPHQRYMLSVQLDHPDYPTYRTIRTFTKSDQFDLTVEGLERYIEVTGRVTYRNAAEDPPSALPVGVVGARIIALSDADASQSSTDAISQPDSVYSLTSTEDETRQGRDDPTCLSGGPDCTDGSFRILVPPQPNATYRIIARQGSSPPIPEVVFEQAFEIRDGQLVNPVGDLFLGDLPPLYKTVPIEVSDANGQPVPECEVVFVAAVGNGTYRESITTDAAGQADAALFAGPYDIFVYPPVTTPWRLQHLEHEFARNDDRSPFAIALQHKVAIYGSVEDFDGRHPVANATVTAIRIDPGSPFNGRSLAVQTDSNGQYEMDIEPACYVVVIQPSEDAGLPTQMISDFPVAEEPSRQVFPIRLDRANLVEGIVTDTDGKPLPDVSVEVFQQLDPSAQQTTTMGGRKAESGAAELVVELPAQLRQLGRAITDSNGIYRLLLSARSTTTR